MSKLNSSVRVMFLRNRQNHAVGCLAITLDRKSNSVDYQYSVLNPLDSFDRKVARHLALGRLLENPISVSVPKDATMHDVSRAVMTSLSSSKKVPTRAVKAAKLWLNDARFKLDQNLAQSMLGYDLYGNLVSGISFK